MPKPAPVPDPTAPDCPTGTAIKPPESLVVALDDLIRDDRLRYRVRSPYFDEDTPAVERYAAAMEEYGGWGEFPPIVAVQLTEVHRGEIDLPNGKTQKVKYPVGAIVLVGGFTRCAAADLQQIPDAPAVVYQGTWEDADRLAWGENSKHGRPRSSDDVKAVIARIRVVHPGLSQRDVAKLAGCGKSSVWRFDNEAEQARKDAAAAKTPHKKPPVESDNPAEAMLSDRKPSDNQPRYVQRDLWGRPVEHIGPLQSRFEAVPKVLRMTNKIREEIVTLASLKHGTDGTEKCLAPGLADVDVNEIAQQVLGLMDRLTDGLPWIVCPVLDYKVGDLLPLHDYCELCGGKKTLTKVQAENLPPELEKKASRWVGDRSRDRDGGDL